MTTKTEDKMEGRHFLVVSRVIVLAGQGLHEDLHAPIEVYDGEDGGQGGGLTFVDGIEGDSLSGQGLHEDLHASIEAYDGEDGG